MRTYVKCGRCGWRGYRKYPLALPCPHCEWPVYMNMDVGVYMLAIVDADGNHARYKHAAHYIGWTRNLPWRLHFHRNGTGSRLVRAVRQAGLDVAIVRTWPHGTRTLERSLKRQGSGARQCPICVERSSHGTCQDLISAA